MQTREIFWSIGSSGVVIFYVVGCLAMAAFAYGVIRHVVKYSRGRSLKQPLEIWNGVRRMLSDLGSHRTLRRRDRWAGIAHHAVFVGCLTAALGTTIIFIDYDIVRAIFGQQYWRGYYYLISSLLLDIGHLGLVAGLLYLLVRRAMFQLPKLDYVRRYRGETELRPPATIWQLEDWAFLLSLLAIELSGFLQEGVRLLMDQPPAFDWSPVGAAVAKLLSIAGLSRDQAAQIRLSNWWIHGVLALAFTAAIPWYKAKHIIAVVGSLALRDEKPLRRLPKENAPPPDAGDRPVGIKKISDLSWKEMLHLDACTKCGRCHDACPARTGGAPLSPRDVILDLRTLADDVGGRDLGDRSNVGNTIAPETLWACMSCGACQEICPVGIEHPSLIVQMRRNLVDADVMEPQLRKTFEAIGSTGNSFGEPSRKRPDWIRDLKFRIKDIRKDEAEFLWFVGDYASFDPRNQKVSRTFAELLHSAGVDFALLHESEWTAGNDVRRAGEEGLFEALVDHNLGSLREAKPFRRIITTDPHSYNTLKNEYPEFGDVAPIDHYSTILLELLESGRLKVNRPLKKKVTFHDPCHLGRLNKGYEPPRKVLEAIGCELIEMPRNRDNSFCCGAGGGRIWIPDTPGVAKPSISRMHEAAALGTIDVFVTCCPKDLTMYEDARKTSGHEQSFKVGDIAELVAEAVARKNEPGFDLPQLTERIVDAIAKRIGDVVNARIQDAFALLPARAIVEQPSLPPPEQIAAPAVASAAGRSEPAPDPVQAEPSRSTAPTARDQAVPAQDAAVTPVVTLTPMDWDTLAPIAKADLPRYEVPAAAGPRLLVAVKHVAILGEERELTGDGRDVLPHLLEHGLNEWDDTALEYALAAVEGIGQGEVVVVTIGDEGAEATLRKALAKGAHRAVRVSPAAASSDPIVISSMLAGVADIERPDLILCGTQSSDHANGSTGAALARILQRPYATVVVEANWNGLDRIEIARELEGGTRERLSLPTPAVIAVQSGMNTPRYATMRMIKEAKRKPITVVDGIDSGSVGGAVVRRMFAPPVTKAEMLTGNADAVAEFVANIVRKKVGARS
ncbi:heterodisulfide reductase-related iron-sulfur binding cluster [Bradyrhizobium sp.]|uniref:heterodisulfide reductase-related iron-sulfur binding cluster n=1 Tax=Bradyrhizobium sp. TaxID=376 RepID=UPI0039E55F57